ncbi:MAG: cobalamin-independent methionine synthase II family protein [Alphaproteobacteria bacterium]
MHRSTDRFLTTHTGSLPRPDDLVRTMFAKEEGVPIDAAALASRVRAAVGEVVRKQIAAGVDIVNDGEVSKPGYASYIKDRADGFGGESKPHTNFKDLSEFPTLLKRQFGDDPGRSRRNVPACNAPIRSRGIEAAEADIANLEAATAGADVAGTFMSAAGPGVVAYFFRNQYYRTHEEYLHAIGAALQPEYEAIAAAGYTLQIDCPDLAANRQVEFADRPLADFRKDIATRIEVLNHVTRNIAPEQMRLHLCWGNYEGPHHHDVPLADIIDLVFTARPAGLSFEAANPRHAHEWALFETVKVPDGKVLYPGVLESKGNFIEHPELVAQRIGRYARLVGRENVIAGTDCGYGTWVGQAAVEPDIVWAKLAVMAEGARLASKEFWGK